MEGLISRLVAFFSFGEVDPSLRGFHHVALLRHLQSVPDSEKDKIMDGFLRHRQYHAVKYMGRVREKLKEQPKTEHNGRKRSPS